MKKRTKLIALLSLVLCGCIQQGAKKTPLVGSNRDSHGCIGSAGYLWSEVRQECIRPFDTGITLLPIDTTSGDGAVLAAFIVFNTDSSKVELFLPDTKNNEILDRRTLPGGGYAWNTEDDDTKNMRIIDGRWMIEQRGRVIYAQDIYPIHATFYGSDNKTKRLYQVGVTFERKRAQVNLDGTVLDLAQYVTADGYGYKSDLADLRGRGDEATLTLRDGLSLSLTQKK